MSKGKKASAKEPFLPLFFGDFLGATAEWDGEERALYLLMLGHQWTLGSLPADPRKLRKLADYQADNFDRWWPTVSVKFEQHGERLVNARLEQHRAKTIELAGKNAAAGKKGAAARWQKDGERHDQAMADAINKSGGRQESANGEIVTGATAENSERQENANGERYGASDGNPSHPIPSHPSPDNSSQDSSGAAPSDQQQPRRAADENDKPGGDKTRYPAPSISAPPQRQPTPASAMAIALRNERVSVTSDDPTLLAWIQDGITTQQLLEAVGVAKIRKPREIIYAKYLDPIVRENRAKAGAAPTDAKRAETPGEREWRQLRNEAAGCGFHRAPKSDETPEEYRQAIKAHDREQTAKAMERMTEMAAKVGAK